MSEIIFCTKFNGLLNQHIRALTSLGHEPPNALITSLLKMKLDQTTMFEWQRHSQSHTDVLDYQELLAFLRKWVQRPVNSMITKVTSDDCISCGQRKHLALIFAHLHMLKR